MAIGDLGIIPLHHQVNLWGTRKGTVYTAAHRRAHARPRIPSAIKRGSMMRNDAVRLHPFNAGAVMIVACCLRVACADSSRPAAAAELVIGLGADVTSIDPHNNNAAPNNSIAEQIFNKLDRERREPETETGARRIVADDRRSHVGIQAAPRREVSRRLGIHRGGRRFFDRAAGHHQQHPAASPSLRARSRKKSSSIRTRSG